MKKETYYFETTMEVTGSNQKEALDNLTKVLGDNEILVINAIKSKRKRTTRQNSALHLYFTQLADALNESGNDMRTVIDKEIDIQWSPMTVKEYLFRPLMKTMLGIKSTTQMNTGDIDKVFDVINKVIGERCGIHIPFPSIEIMMDQD